MIITECTNSECNEPIIIEYEGGVYGFYRYECKKCKAISFIELTSISGETLPEDEFFKKHPNAIPPKPENEEE